MKVLRYCIATAMFTTLFGCNSSGGPAEPTGPASIEMESIPSGNATLSKVRSLCQLATDAKVVGHYEVERLVSNMGTNLWNVSDPAPMPNTMVHLDGVSFVGEDSPRIEMNGGTWPNGDITGGIVGFTAGEEVLVFLEYKWPDGKWRVIPESVMYKRSDGSFANEYLLTRGAYSADDVKARVLAARAGNCADDVLPTHVVDAEAAQNRPPAVDEPEHVVYPTVTDMGSGETDAGR